jgi:hypothetical protein
MKKNKVNTTINASKTIKKIVEASNLKMAILEVMKIDENE